MYLFDSAAVDDKWIWIVRRTQFQGNRQYAGNACLSSLSSKCYKFYFFDEWGDGLSSGNGLTLTLDGTQVLRIIPGDPGTVFEAGKVATYWSQEFGSCTAISANNNGVRP